jgi:hypothetical protein
MISQAAQKPSVPTRQHAVESDHAVRPAGLDVRGGQVGFRR